MARERSARSRTLPSVSEHSDEEVWARAVAGDGDAYGILFDRHRGRLYRHAHALAPGGTDADDAVAVSFFEAWRRREAIRFVDGSMLPWLLRTCTYAMNNLARASKRYQAALSRLPTPEPHEDPADLTDEGEATSALRNLSLLDRQVVTLCVLEDLTDQEAAHVLGVRVGTVKSRLSRAKSRLRQQLDITTALSAKGITREI